MDTDKSTFVAGSQPEGAPAREYEELRRLFQLIETAKQEWEESMDCVADMVILTDAADNIRRCNRSFMHFAGRPYQEIIGRNWAVLLGECGLTAETRLDEGREVRHPRQDRWFLMNRYATRSTRGKPSGTVITIQDTTQVRRITRELERKNREIEAAYAELKATQARILQQDKMASLGRLAAGIAHEINNPLGFIASNLETLRKYVARLTAFVKEQAAAIAGGAEPDAVRKLGETRASLKLDHILGDAGKLIGESLDGADRVKTIIRDLKGFSRANDDVPVPADVNAGLESTLHIVWNEIKYKATVTKEYGRLPLTRCHPGQLNQVFMNLLVNAAQAIENKGEIAIRTWCEHGVIGVSIADTGCGILPENRDRVFEPFFTTKEAGKGTGLGLSIVYDIVKKHNGEITVESEAGKGATFTVRIPVVEDQG